MAQWTGVLECGGHYIYSIPWLCRNSVAAVAKEER